MALAMTNRDREDICGCKMATINCVVSELLLVEANELTQSDYSKPSMKNNEDYLKPGAPL
jgi:hypothetical protein